VAKVIPLYRWLHTPVCGVAGAELAKKSPSHLVNYSSAEADGPRQVCYNHFNMFILAAEIRAEGSPHPAGESGIIYYYTESLLFAPVIGKSFSVASLCSAGECFAEENNTVAAGQTDCLINYRFRCFEPSRTVSGSGPERAGDRFKATLRRYCSGGGSVCSPPTEL
jgi:hypothetical protein